MYKINKKLIFLSFMFLIVFSISNVFAEINYEKLNSHTLFYLNLDNNTNDSTNNNIDFSITNQAQVNTNSILGNSFILDGYDDCIYYNTTNSMFHNQDFIMNYWINIYETEPIGRHFTYHSADNNGFTISSSALDDIVFFNGNGYQQTQSDTTLMSINNWHFISVVKQSDNRVLLYVDGDLKQNQSNSNSIIYGLNNLVFGCDNNLVSWDTKAYFDEISYINTSYDYDNIIKYIYNEGNPTIKNTFPFQPNIFSFEFTDPLNNSNLGIEWDGTIELTGETNFYDDCTINNSNWEMLSKEDDKFFFRNINDIDNDDYILEINCSGTIENLYFTYYEPIGYIPSYTESDISKASINIIGKFIITISSFIILIILSFFISYGKKVLK